MPNVSTQNLDWGCGVLARTSCTGVAAKAALPVGRSVLPCARTMWEHGQKREEIRFRDRGSEGLAHWEATQDVRATGASFQ
ncbi:MAG: hypothetical protein JO105_07770 [Hyphomicrobiales bacterium]|nr:hypothetical protein [Hyphomicrobiales bacterium]MBV9975276.1 hypothetical protein [Hyphomicrobiales bacterium]